VRVIEVDCNVGSQPPRQTIMNNLRRGRFLSLTFIVNKLIRFIFVFKKYKRNTFSAKTLRVRILDSINIIKSNTFLKNGLKFINPNK